MARNCGLLARDLTEAAFEAGSGKRYDSRYGDSYPEIRVAERAITDRIHELERENRDQAKRIKQLEYGYDELRTIANRLHAAAQKEQSDVI